MNPIILLQTFLLSSSPLRILLQNSHCIVDVVKKDESGDQLPLLVPPFRRSYCLYQQQDRQERLGVKVMNCQKYENLKNQNTGEYCITNASGINARNSNISKNMNFHVLGIDEGLRLTVPVSTNKSPPMSMSMSVEKIKKTNIGTRLLLSDDVVNIWEFCIEPGERCAFHYHTLPYLFINLTKSLTQALDIEGRPSGKPSLQKVGQMTFVDERSLGSHGVRNVGEETFLQFVVEFK